MESKTVVYTPDAGSGSGSGMMAMLAPLLQQKGIDPNLLMAFYDSKPSSIYVGLVWCVSLLEDFLIPQYLK